MEVHAERAGTTLYMIVRACLWIDVHLLDYSSMCTKRDPNILSCTVQHTGIINNY